MNGWDEFRKQLASRLGLSKVADAPYDLIHRPGVTVARVPGPNDFEIDGKPQESTHDIIGIGRDEEEAFEDAFSKYLAARETVMTPRKRLAEQTKYVIN